MRKSRKKMMTRSWKKSLRKRKNGKVRGVDENPKQANPLGQLLMSNTTEDNICEDYKRRNCPYGRTGELLIIGERCKKTILQDATDSATLGNTPEKAAKEARNAGIGTPSLQKLSIKPPLHQLEINDKTEELRKKNPINFYSKREG